MGIFANFLEDAQSIDVTPEVTASDRRILNEIEQQTALGDPPRPVSLDYTPRNEIQTMPASGATGGTFTGSLGVRFNNRDNLVPVDVDLAWDADESDIQTAIDNALNGVVPGYVDGDLSIFIAGTGNASTNNVQFRYNGDSLKATAHPVGLIDDTLLIGGTERLFERVAGHTARDVWEIMRLYSLVEFGGTPPRQGGALPTLTKIIDTSISVFSSPTLRAFATEAAIQDHIVGLEEALLTAFGLQ